MTSDLFSKRKQDHLHLALDIANQAQAMNAFDSVRLWHEAIPEGDLQDVDTRTTLLGLSLPTPFFVSSMTAGHKDAPQINSILMEACSQSHWLMGVGSQRRALSDKTDIDTWAQLRKRFPDVKLMANLGLAQLITTSIDQLEALVASIEAVAFIVHCNPLQECIQPEGTPNFKGAYAALEKVAKALSVPVVVKETGCGFSANTIQRLLSTGIHAIDVSGLGGTHWGRIEGKRAPAESKQAVAAQVFENWGVTTVQSLQLAQACNPQIEIWASGGVRHGLDAAKAIALGAKAVGFAKPMLEAAMVSAEKVYNTMQTIEYALQVALFCTGAFTLEGLKEKLC